MEKYGGNDVVAFAEMNFVKLLPFSRIPKFNEGFSYQFLTVDVMSNSEYRFISDVAANVTGSLSYVGRSL